MKRYWLHCVTVIGVLLFGGSLPVLLLASHLFAGRTEIPLCAAFEIDSETGVLTQIERASHMPGGSGILVRSAPFYDQEYYISRPSGDNGADRVWYGQFGGQAGHLLRPDFEGHLDSSDLIIAGLDAPGGSLALIVHTTERRDGDPIRDSPAVVSVRGRKVPAAFIISIGAGATYAAALLLAGLGLGWAMRSGFDVAGTNFRSFVRHFLAAPGD